jgi:hypothetical protein
MTGFSAVSDEHIIGLVTLAAVSVVVACLLLGQCYTVAAHNFCHPGTPVCASENVGKMDEE